MWIPIGIFFYKADNEETDIEILTGNLASGVHYTDQNLVLGGASTTATHAIPSDATARYHEYRLDWIKGKTLFYLDGVLQQTFTANVPNVAGEWIWNNWRLVILSFCSSSVFFWCLGVKVGKLLTLMVCCAVMVTADGVPDLRLRIML